MVWRPTARVARYVADVRARTPFTKLAGGIIVLALMAASCSEKKSRPRQEEDDASSAKGDGARPEPREEVPPLFPNDDASSIPTSVGAVRRFSKSFHGSAAQGFKEHFVPEAAWSRMAQELCRGADVYQHMVLSGSGGAGTAMGKALKDPAAAKSQLECGRATFEAMDGAVRQLFVTTNGSAIDAGPGAPFGRVSVREIALDRLPIPAGTTSQDNLGDLEGVLCSGTDSICIESVAVTGRVRGKKVYLTGDPDEAKQVAKALIGATTKHPQAEAWAVMAKLIPRETTQEVGIGRAFRLGFIYGLGAFPSTITKVEKEGIGKAFDKLLREGVETYGLADTITAYGGEMVLVLVPSKDTDAESLASSLTSWKKDVVAALDKVGGGSPSTNGMVEAEARFVKLYDVWARRSLEEARIVAKDGRVTVTFERRLTTEEKATVAAMEEIFLARSRRGVELVKLLLRGESPPDRLFEGIGGAKYADQVRDARK